MQPWRVRRLKPAPPPPPATRQPSSVPTTPPLPRPQASPEGASTRHLGRGPGERGEPRFSPGRQPFQRDAQVKQASSIRETSSRVAGLTALAIAGMVAIATGWILLGGGSSTNPSSNTGQATQPQGTSVTRAVASTTSTTAQVSKPQVVASLDTVIRSIVEIAADCPEGQWGGSGTIVLDGTYVLTNHHVAPDNQCEYVVCFTESWTEEPSCDAFGEWVAADIENDLAVLELIAPDGGVYKASGEPVLITGTSTSINEEIFLVGYPGVGGSTITSVRGVVSGLLTIPPGTGELQGEFIKTDARSGPGVSGGAAFNSAGEYIGTPTGGRVNIEEGTSLGFIRPGRFARTLLESLDEG